MMFHGAGVSSEIFSLDSIDTNLLEYLLQYGQVVFYFVYKEPCQSNVNCQS